MPNSSSSRFQYALYGFVLVMSAIFIAISFWPAPKDTKPTSLMIVISGDTAGWIVPCGCTSNQSGGLLRRGTFIKQQQGQDVILADAGGAASGTTDYHRVKFESILRGELAMGAIAHNIGQSEAALGADYLKKLAQEAKIPFVSANVTGADGQRLFPAVRIIERHGKRIAFAGVMGKQYNGPGMAVREPKDALLDAIAEQQGKYDSLIILAYLNEEEMTQLASAIPEADAIIGGPTGQAIKPRLVGQTLVGSATNKGKFLVALDADLQSKLSWTGRIIELNQSFSDDAQQQQNVNAYLAELEKRDFAAADTGFVPILNRSSQSQVAGNDSCVKCHQGDCKQWDGSKHAHAWKTLHDKGYHVDAYCQQCHTTGFGMESGFVSARRSLQRTSVGCESCHGPSQAHVQNVKIKTPFNAKDQCIKCHDPENSPLFQYDAYWPRIVHGKQK